MKSTVAAIGRALDVLQCKELSTEIERVAKALASTKAKNLNAIRNVLARASHGDPKAIALRLQSILPALAAFHEVLLVASAKKKVLDELKALLDLFDEYRQLSIDEFCQALCPPRIGEHAMGHQLVDAYLDRLEEVLGDEQKFSAVYEALTADKRIAQAEAVELASRFLAPIAKSTSRPKALRRVLYRHEKLLESRAVSASMAARR
jgi:hypothetical protein